ncbi:MAG: hypothetical protein KA436_12630 [Oligoflexales bacterium]|nr:hypothetical protein [Oligoflexales bacterium]
MLFIKFLVCILVLPLLNCVPASVDKKTKLTPSVQSEGELRKNSLIHACNTKGDCSEEERTKIADAFCQAKSFATADHYTVENFIAPYSQTRSGDKEKIYQPFSMKACELSLTKQTKKMKCSWTELKFKNKASAPYFNAITCLDRAGHSKEYGVHGAPIDVQENDMGPGVSITDDPSDRKQIHITVKNPGHYEQTCKFGLRAGVYSVDQDKFVENKYLEYQVIISKYSTKNFKFAKLDDQNKSYKEPKLVFYECTPKDNEEVLAPTQK